jgi:hypothetical protein
VQNSQVKLLVDVNTLVDEDRLYKETLWRCLMSDQVVSNHLLGESLNLLRGLTDLDSTLESTGELSLSTASCFYLCLKDKTTLI